MQINRKIENLATLSKVFASITDNSIRIEESLVPLQQKGIELIEQTQHYNGWFSPEAVKKAFATWAESLKAEKTAAWLKAYKIDQQEKKVGVIMAGNIPMVGLHDALVVLLSDKHLFAKLSSKDEQLMKFALQALAEIDDEWADRIHVNQSFNAIDVLIATGSNNSARYFEYYFRDKQKLIRKNRTSVAILDGKETSEELAALADDVFTYYGLGCRNVTKLFLPENYDMDQLFKAFYPYRNIINHNKYANNYDYNKSVYLLNQIPLLENGFLLLKEDLALHAPVGVLYYETYDNKSNVEEKLASLSDEIQCIVSKSKKAGHLAFGETQQPELWDYADGVDTMAFLNQ